MGKIAVFLADGFEEIEGLTVVDICRRCGLKVETVSIMGREAVMSSHLIPIGADIKLEDADFSQYDCLVLPGGMPGTTNLEACVFLMNQLDFFYRAGKTVAAICAAPSIFGHRGYLQGRNATCYPSFESHLTGAVVTHRGVEVSDNVITGRGMGTAIDFALTVASVFAGTEKADEVARSVCYHE